ncbi:MAG TPA: Rieske 2Fe-2S domain-containing protein [Chloroflexota bacterium]|nr:Rieske 2Fe-2S domain-containing protein [Chloroflexota bacterium]
MLTKEENELLTRVGPGTPMGQVMRQYWLPALLSSELPEPDCAPLRMRLLGEDLIAFRDSSGRVGMLAANCPHRGASLFFGRNEESGLRCVYHGWKFDVSGACVDMPNEPVESSFKHKVKAVAYPCVERAGVVFVYMGPREVPPPLPELEWMSVPESHRIVAKRVQFTNYAQSIEGEIDSSHLGFTHSRVSDHRPLTPEEIAALPSAGRYTRQDRHPRFDVLDTDYGVLIAARREAEADSYYYRISQFLMPFWTLVASGTERRDPTRGTRAFIPIDDESVLVFATSFHPLRPLTDVEREPLKVGGGAGFVGEDHFRPATSAPFGAWIPIAAAENDYLLDREAQRTTHYAGMAEFWAQDAALQEGMGKIYDRRMEHLGSSDTAIIRMRARLIGAAKAMRESGAVPPGVDEPELYRVRASVAVLPRDESWVPATDHLRRVIPGTNPGGPEVGLAVPSTHQRV